LRCSFCTWLPE